MKTLFDEANLNHRNGNFPKAIELYEQLISKILPLPKSEPKSINLATSYLNLGNSYKENYEFVKAKSNFNKALKIFQKLDKTSKGNFDKEIAWTFNNIGCSFLMQRNFDKSLEYNQKSLKIREKLFSKNEEQYKIDYLMSLYNISLSNQQLKFRNTYITQLNEFIEEFERLKIDDEVGLKHYKDAKSRLSLISNPKYKELKPKNEIEEDVNNFLKTQQGFEPSIPQTEKILKDFTSITGGLITSFQRREGLEQWYFRVRPKNGMKDGDELYKNQFSYPPTEYTGFGRVNLPNHPVFYGGEKIDVVIQETHIKEGDFFYLSCWRSGDFYPRYALMHSKNIRSQRIKERVEYKRQVMEDGLKGMPDLIAESFQFIEETLSEIFTTDDWTISSSIGYQLLYGKEDVDGIEYPDVKTRTSYNFALKPEAADKLIFYKVFHCQLKNNEVEYLEVGETSNNKDVIWREIREEDKPVNDPNNPTKLMEDDG